MTLEALYRRLLFVVSLLALAVAGFAVYRFYDWRPAGMIITCGLALALAGGALLSRKGRLWRPMLLLALGSGICTAAALALLPWWVAVPAGLGILACALLGPAMFRRDRLAATVATVVASGLGIQAAWAVDALAHPPVSRLDEVRPAPPRIEARTEAYWRGVRDARRDLAAGRMRMLTYGYPAGWLVDYRAALARDGIELEAVAGCMVTYELTEHARGYNAIMEKGIARLLGADYLARKRQAAKAAKAAWDVAHAER